MRVSRILLLAAILGIFLASCKKDLDINDQWKEIVVVYGLLNSNDTIHYVKITKAFLGPGNALEYAKIEDSSNFLHKINVRMDEYDAQNNYVRTYLFDTTTITNKDSGVFYYPDQLMYYTVGNLSSTSTYKIIIEDTTTNLLVYSETPLVGQFSISSPSSVPSARANFEIDKYSKVVWKPAPNGASYQLLIRFWYWELNVANPLIKEKKYVDWLLFNNQPESSFEVTTSGLDYIFLGNGFYKNIKAKVPYDPSVERVADSVDYIITVASEQLYNYMEVTNPSNTIVQEKPVYTNIVNGIGLFSSKTDNTVFDPRHLRLSDKSLLELKFGQYTDSLF
jgi:hypothetical protein